MYTVVNTRIWNAAIMRIHDMSTHDIYVEFLQYMPPHIPMVTSTRRSRLCSAVRGSCPQYKLMCVLSTHYLTRACKAYISRCVLG